MADKDAIQVHLEYIKQGVDDIKKDVKEIAQHNAGQDVKIGNLETTVKNRGNLLKAIGVATVGLIAKMVHSFFG